MKKTTLTILMTFILFASGYAQNNENVFGSTYKLVEGYSKVPSDGTYLIAGYLSEDSGGSLYLMSSDNLNNGVIKGRFHTKVTTDAPPATIVLDESSLSGLEYRFNNTLTDKNIRKFRITLKGQYLTNVSNSRIEFQGTRTNNSFWILSEANPDKYRIRFYNNGYKIAFNKNDKVFEIRTIQTQNPDINLYRKVSHAIKIGKTGYSTFYYSTNDAKLPEGLTAYTYSIKQDGDVMKLVSSHQFNAGDTIPANCAVVVKGKPGDYSIDLLEPTSTEKYENVLKGTNYAKVIDNDANKQYYMLSLDNNGENVGFYWGAADGRAFTNKAHGAYLAIEKSANGKVTSFVLNPEGECATGITSVKTDSKKASAIYDLSGRRTVNPSHGFYIINGKKYLK
ncbi:MAG: hypothetical protein SOU48_05455 [Prevotella sp.]|nr:hypothetical protein [Prevotella sp.]MDY2805925.1 hypothetical protein [Prevotella sp.]